MFKRLALSSDTIRREKHIVGEPSESAFKKRVKELCDKHGVALQDCEFKDGLAHVVTRGPKDNHGPFHHELRCGSRKVATMEDSAESAVKVMRFHSRWPNFTPTKAEPGPERRSWVLQHHPKGESPSRHLVYLPGHSLGGTEGNFETLDEGEVYGHNS
jgi:hypothetical protein